MDQPTNLSPENQVAKLGASLRRRMRTFAGVLGGGVLIALALAVLWPATYRSSATIYVEPPDVTSDGVDAEDLPARQIARVTQRVMTTANLAPVLRDTGLYDEVGLTMIDRVERLQENYTLDQVTAESVDSRGRPIESVVTFSIAFTDPSAQTAQNVVNRLVTLYLRENTEIRRSRVAERARFLGNEADRIAASIQDLEERKAEFRVDNGDMSPGAYQTNLQLLQRAESDLLETDRRLAALEERLIYLDAELSSVSAGLSRGTRGATPVLPAEQLAAAEADLRVLTSRYGDSHPDVVSKRRQIDALRLAIADGRLRSDDPELAEARVALTTARERYTDNHPEVVRLQQRVNDLEALSAEAGDGEAPPSSEAEVRLRADMVSAQAEARSLLGARQLQIEQVSELQAVLARLPEIELNYGEITRDLDNLRKQYQSIKEQQLNARVAVEVETQRRGQRFVLIEDPSLPTEPFTPNRGAIMFLGLVVSLFLAVLLVAMIEALDTTVHGRGAIVDIFGAPPLAAIPVIGGSPSAVALGNSRALFIVGGLVVGLIVLLLLVHSFVIELPLLFGQLL